MGDWNGRVGAGKVSRLGGVRRECDPGAIPLAPVTDFRDLENARWRGPHIINRGGQSKLTSGGALSGGCVTGLFGGEYHDDEQGYLGWDRSSVIWNSVLYLGSQAIGVSPGIGVPGPYSWNIRRISPFASYPKLFMSTAFFGADNGLARPLRHWYDPEASPPTQVFNGTVLDVATLEDTGQDGDYIAALQGFNGSLYAAVFSSIPAPSVQGVYRISGATFVAEDVPLTPVHYSCEFLVELNAELYSMWRSDGVTTPVPPSTSPGYPIIRKRSGGGSWSTVATFPNSATVTHTVTGVAVYDSLIYLLVTRTDWTAGVQTGARVQLWTFDGASLTLVRTVVTEVATPPTVGTAGLLVFNGLLYYAWRDVGGTAMKLGTLDSVGPVYTDTHKDFTGIADQSDSLETHPRLAEINGSLAVIHGNAVTNVVVSPGTNTAGAWVATATAERAFPLVLDTL